MFWAIGGLLPDRLNQVLAVLDSPGELAVGLLGKWWSIGEIVGKSKSRDRWYLSRP
jgi:hypothetical protein